MSTLMYKSGSSWIDVIHPVGSVWLSNSSTSPSSLFGGTWQQLTNAVLRAAAAYGYNGSDSMTLTTSNMPSHTHSMSKIWHYQYGEGRFVLPAGSNNIFIGDTKDIYTNSTGGGQAFSKLPRYCNIYCWVRTG